MSTIGQDLGLNDGDKTVGLADGGITMRSGRSSSSTGAEVAAKFVSEGQGLPAGSTVHVDKRFLEKYMPKFSDKIQKVIDELAKRWDPKALEASTGKRATHRALEDVQDSTNELKHYRDCGFVNLQGLTLITIVSEADSGMPDGPSHLDDVADEDAWLRSVFREEELEAPGQQRGPSSEQSDAAQDVDMDPQQRTTEDAPDTVMENVRSSCQGDNPCEDVDLIPARRTDWYSMWDKDDPTELVDAGLAKFKGLPATDALDLLPDEHRARGIAALQVVTRHHPYLVEARTKAKSVSPSAGARVGPAHEAPSSVLAPPCPTASAAASAANEAPSSVEDAEDPRTLWRREQLVKFGKMKLQQQLEVAANTD
ncbi:Oligoribonuclease, mitochondrial, partial [Perkinsus olseni]